MGQVLRLNHQLEEFGLKHNCLRSLPVVRLATTPQVLWALNSWCGANDKIGFVNS